MYKHILVALDASNNASEALKHAIALSLISKAKLTLAHVINSVDMAIDFPQLMYQPATDEMGKKYANELINEAEQKASHAGITDIARYVGDSPTNDRHDIINTLLAHSEQANVDIIVIGTHGRSGLMHVLMGSFAESLIRYSKIPLLVVRDPKCVEK